MSRNRHTSSRRTFGKSKTRQAKQAQSSSVNYEQLEEKRLLAVDFGVSNPALVDITSGTAGSGQTISGGVGPNHIVETANGQFQVYDRAGNQLVSKNLDTFWTDTGAAGAEADPSFVSNTNNSRVVYDVDTRRWFIASASNADAIAGQNAPRAQKPVLVAVSRTSDPTGHWTSLFGLYDHDSDFGANTGPAGRQGGYLPFGDYTPIDGSYSINLSIDDHNIYVTSDWGPGTSNTYVFNKFSQLVVPTPNNLNPVASLVAAADVQWHTDVFGTELGSAFGVSTDFAVTGGNSILLAEYLNPEIPGGGAFGADTFIPVDAYEEPPLNIRQERDPDIINGGSGNFTSAVRRDNSLWVVHTIKGDFEAQNPDGGVTQNSALRWYEIDLDTKSVKQSGTIQHEFQNYIFPSIAVTVNGDVAISFTTTGVSPDGPSFGVFPSSALAAGYDVNGVMTFEEPVILKDGEDGFLDNIGNFWGGHKSIVADPFNPDSVWVFSQWANAGDPFQGNGVSRQITEVVLVGHSPIVTADNNDNTIIVRRSAVDNTQIEVEIDGIVVGSYAETQLHEVILNGGGGNDTFIIDTTNGEFLFEGGVSFEGDGNDLVQMVTVHDTNWEVIVDGSGTASVGNDFPATCEEHVDDEVNFQLNFEPGSLWFDATLVPNTSIYFDPANTALTQGEVLQRELQNYFDSIIEPLFAGLFTVELDILDDETDTLASAAALGFGTTDVGGQDLYVASPWSILTGRGDTNGDLSDGIIDYNLDLALYGGDFDLLVRNVAGGLTRNQLFNKVLAMEAETPDETSTFDPRGVRNLATPLDIGLHDLNDAQLLGNYDPLDSTYLVQNYVTNAIWAGDNSGVYFLGIADDGSPMQLPINSNAELIDFDTVASSLAGSSRNGSFHDIIEQDRAFLRGLGYNLNPINPVDPSAGLLVNYTGMDRIQAGDGVDYFCIRSSNVDLEVRGGIGNDVFNVTGLGVGAIDLLGEAGNDSYQVVFSPAGVITISDSVGSERDTLLGLGTTNNDVFEFNATGISVNAGQLVHSGLEIVTYDGREGDDDFVVNSGLPGIASLIGGLGDDTFTVNDTANATFLNIQVQDPAAAPVDQLRLGISGNVTDTFLGDGIENFAVDGTFRLQGINGTPTVAGGLNLIGDGNETLNLTSSLDATWDITGDGSGILTQDVAPTTFTGINLINGGQAADTFNVTMTDLDMTLLSRLGDDIFNIANTGIGVITADGSSGDDQFNVTNSGGGVDLSGDAGIDTFVYDDIGAIGSGVLRGGLAGDIFNILNSGFNSLDIDGEDGLDTFNIDNTGTATLTVLGGNADDTFNVIDAASGDKFATGIMALSNDAVATINQLPVDVLGGGQDQLILTAVVPGAGGVINSVVLNLGQPAPSRATFAGGVLTFDMVELFSVNVTTTQLVALVNAEGTFTATGDSGRQLLGTLDQTPFVTRNGRDAGNAQIQIASDTSGNAFNGVTVTLIEAGGGGNTATAAFNGPNIEVTVSGTVSYVDIATAIDGLAGFSAAVMTSVGDPDYAVALDTEPAVVSLDGGGDAAIVSLQGQSGNDTYVVTNVDGTIIFEILDSINAENDTLIASGTDGDDAFMIGALAGQLGTGLPWTVEGIENLSYDGGLGNDTFDVDMGDTWNGVLNLTGGDGDDGFVIRNGGMGEIVLDGTLGDDSYTVFFTPTTDVTIVDTGTGLADSFFGFGTDLVDVFNLAIGTAEVNGGTVDMSGIDSVQYDGLDGDDTFNVATTIGTTTILGGLGIDTFNVDSTSDGNDFSGNEGNDIFNINFTAAIANFRGDDGDDEFNVFETDGRGNYFGGNDNDTFNIFSAIGNSNFYGEAGSDYFEITDHLTKGSAGLIMIDGGSERNRIKVNGYTTEPNFVNITSPRITGMSAVPIEFVTPANGTFSIANEVGGIELIGSDLADIFIVNNLDATDSLKIQGLAGDDLFTVAHGALGTVSADGHEGSDLYRYALGSANNRFMFARDTGVAGIDRIVATLTQNDDMLTLSGESFQVDTDRFGFNQNFESMIVDTLGGNDHVEINALNLNFLRVSTSDGDDTINVNNFSGVNNILAIGGNGNDNIRVDSGTVAGFFQGLGGLGDDTLTITQRSYNTAFLDGQEGSDTYDVYFADRSDRFVVPRDTGTTGTDVLNVFGTVLDDFIEMRVGVVRTAQQDIFYNGTEVTNLDTDGSADNVTLYGVSSPTTNIITGEGHDFVTINATWGPSATKTINVDLGSGRDVANVNSTDSTATTNLFGRAGDDLFNIGSAFEDNNGNLDVIQGLVHVAGEGGNDFMYINDAGKGSAFHVAVTPTSIMNNGSPSNFFGGITFDDTLETLRMDMTEFRNDVLVTPSLDTFFSFVGNSGFNSISLTGDPLVDGRQFYGTNGGNGGWAFTQHKDVIFEDFFI